MRSATFPRALGALTAAYGVYTLARPHSLARLTGLLTADRPASPATRNLGLAIGARVGDVRRRRVSPGNVGGEGEYPTTRPTSSRPSGP